MRPKRSSIIRQLVLPAICFACLLITKYAVAYEYEVTAIQPLAGHTASMAMGINNLGEVVGRFYNVNASTGKATNRQAFVWDTTKGARSLPSLHGDSSAWHINDNGFVTGYSYNANGYQRAVLWDIEEDTMVDIGALKNAKTGTYGNASTCYNINNRDQVVGNADIPNDDKTFTPFHAFLFDQANGIWDLGTLTTERPEWQNGYSIAYDINNRGDVVGIAHGYDGSWSFLPFIDDETNGMQALQRDPNYLVCRRNQ